MFLWCVYVPLPLIGCLIGILGTVFRWSGGAPPLENLLGGSALAAFGIGMHFFVVKNMRRVVQWNSELYPRLLVQWRSTYQCNKCGRYGVPVAS